MLQVALVQQEKKFPNSTTNNSNKNTVHTNRNKLRENRIFSKFFQYINISRSGILSVDEFLEFTAKIDIHLSEDEAKAILTSMDTNNNV